MIRKAPATVIDGPVSLAVAPAGDIIALDLWAGTLPDLGVRTLHVEPRRWWLFDAAGRDDIAAEIAGNGAMAPIGGGLMRAVLTGPGWRGLLMISAVFDAENPGFRPGQVAATVIHHVPVWIAPIAADACEVYFAASHGEDLVALWTRRIALSAAGASA